jgi:pimeloyl-ACP methyl ester carboxylesterase
VSGARPRLTRMDVILIPGFWLDASSWSEVSPALVEAGHMVHALTLPGLSSIDEDRSGISFQDHVDAVVAEIDALPGEVALVGHSGGGTIAGAAADARVERVAHVVYVDSFPLGEGGAINPDAAGENGFPLPDWSEFEDEALVDMTDEIRAEFRARSIPEPVRVASDPVHPTDERRYDVPTTIIATAFPRAVYEQFMEQDAPMLAELKRMRRRVIVDLPTGHWPQFTKPRELGASLVEALAQRP